MKLVLKRVLKSNECTIGELYSDNIFICNTLEDVDRGLTDSMSLDEIKSKKVYGETAIPYGTYNINMDTVSPKFKDRQWAKPFKGILPRLENVKGYEGVLIHVGNSAKDSLGCILVGERFQDNMVINSTSNFKKLMSMLLLDHKIGNKIELTIE